MACIKVSPQLFKQQQAERKPQPQPQEPSPASTEGNPVGRVQEHTQKQLWPLPAYSFECVDASNPATRRFTCTVRLRDWSCRGVGTSKRLAKRQAAAELLHQLLTSEASPAPQLPPIPLLKAPAPIDEDKFQWLRTSKRLASAARAGAEVSGMFRGVRARKAGPPLPPVEPATAVAPSEQLTELGKTHRFGIQFLPLDSSGPRQGAPSTHRSVVKLSTMPTIVVVGCGASVTESREEACRAALEYLAVLTKDNLANKK